MTLQIAGAQDFGNHFTTANGGIASLTAGGAGDAVEVVGDWFDILGLNSTYGVEGVRFHSLGIVIAAEGDVGAGETLDVTTIKLEHCDPDSNGDPDAGTAAEFDSDESVATTELLAGAVTAGRAVYKKARLVTAAKQFVRLKFTPDLSRANTDTAKVAGLLVLGGAHVPADQPKA